ncbi:MAG: hypothetical protein GY868_01690, partial [Deltaproteobacteria bacterium]|nr:hypothetical protein [Deltaproteobacteria bacterium]
GDLNAAYPDFSELKRGLWMARLILTPYDMPADMTFEFIVVPDFQPNLIPPIGHHLTLRGSQFYSTPVPGEQFESWYRDAPSNWKTPEVGLRIRGFSGGFDWSLLYFHHRLRNGDPLERAYSSLGQKLGATINSAAITGQGRLKHNVDYPWQNTFGVTVNTTIDRKIPIIPGTNFAMSGNVLRFEGVFELNKDNVRLAPDYSWGKHV